MDFTGERMRLDVLINEIAKNIFDHANKIGSLSIVRKGNSFEFSMRDGGQNYYDFDECLNHSTSAMNGINFGVGLKTIRDFAEFLGIDLHIDTSKGFSYSGIYRK
ncbi:MAG: ATP-binding protein [Candidatus Kaiserbacteria bacterium]|nr:ATP-binding protein [Candidatus Kaiserbacteria bacterium]